MSANDNLVGWFIWYVDHRGFKQCCKLSAKLTNAAGKPQLNAIAEHVLSETEMKQPLSILEKIYPCPKYP